MSLVLHAVEHGRDDLVAGRAADIRRHERARRERTHASGVRPAVVVEDALVILRGTKRHEGRAVGEDEVRRFLPDQKLFEHDAIAGVAEPAIDHHRGDDRFGGRAILGDDDTLAGRETVGLHDQGIPELAATNRVERRRGRVADAKRAVGTRCRAMKSFANALLDSSAAAAFVGPTIARPAAAKTSTTPRLSGSSGPTTVRSMSSTLRDRQQFGRRGDVSGQTAGDRGDPGVSRRADHARHVALARQFPRERVLARAAPDDEDFHGFRLTGCLVMSCAGERARGRCVTST